MSGSMTRFGKYGQAKKVAMALQSLVRSRYQGDFLQVVGFYTYASPLSERQLLSSAPKPVSMYDPRIRLRVNLDRPPRFVPEHFTNIHAGLEFARRIWTTLAVNKQIIIVTDGEPTAHIEGREIVMIYPPAEQTARLTLAEAETLLRRRSHHFELRARRRLFLPGPRQLRRAIGSSDPTASPPSATPTTWATWWRSKVSSAAANGAGRSEFDDVFARAPGEPPASAGGCFVVSVTGRVPNQSLRPVVPCHPAK